MTPKSVALVLWLGLTFLSGCANQSADRMHDGKHSHAGPMMQGPDMKRKCAKMMEHHGQKGANEMMRKRESAEDMDMKGCKMMKDEDQPDSAQADRHTPENSDDHSAHHPQP